MSGAAGISLPVCCSGIRSRVGTHSSCERRRYVDRDFGERLAFGTYDDALRMVGAKGEPRTAATAVSAARIQLFAAMVRDGNPSYWDSEFARLHWGGLLAPPALLMGWLIAPPWQPGGRRAASLIALR